MSSKARSHRLKEVNGCIGTFVRRLGENSSFILPTRTSAPTLEKAQRVIASIDSSLLRRAAEQMELRGLCDFDNRWSFDDDQIRHLLTEMDREMGSGWAMGSLYGDLLSMSLSVVLIKKYARTSSMPVLLKGGLSRQRLRQVQTYIEENLHRDIRLHELAALANLSMFHFARSFRESSGVTPHQHIIQRRIERAKTLLMQAEWNIEQVASASGFAGGSQFQRSFGRTQASPLPYGGERFRPFLPVQSIEER